MPTSHDHPTLDALGRLAVTTLAYALGMGLVALALPHVFTPMPVAALLPEPPPVVARVPVATPSTEPAP